MHFKEAYYQENFQVADFKFRTWGALVSVNAGESMDDAYKMAREIVHEQYKKSKLKEIPASTPTNVEVPLPEIKKETFAEVSMIDEINNCQKTSELLELEFLSKQKTEWQTAYDLKMIELSKK